MSKKLTAQIPTELDVEGSYQIVWAAIDPTTGADVTGVTISKATVQAENIAGSAQLPADYKPVLLRQTST